MTAAWLLPWALALATFAVFAPALQNGFVDWDDHVNLVHNASYRGLGWAQDAVPTLKGGSTRLRVEVVMVETPDGWVVSDVETT